MNKDSDEIMVEIGYCRAVLKLKSARMVGVRTKVLFRVVGGGGGGITRIKAD